MILVAIGSNMPSPAGALPRATCQAALEALRAIPGLRLLAASRWYATAPIPAAEQPDYVNGMARLEGEMAPEALLGRLHAIEALAGRVRGEVNAARPLDLDIIAMDSTVRAGVPPILPHPRAHLRAFVLRPMQEVAPEWQHPLSGLTAAGMLAALPAQRIRPL